MNAIINKPFGLHRHTHTQAAINFRPSDGLCTAYDLQEQGLVTIKLIKSHSQQYSRVCKTEYWSTYEVSPTEKGLALLDAYDAYWANHS